jgi:hypothetical protein
MENENQSSASPALSNFARFVSKYGIDTENINENAKQIYRQLVQLIHPDKHTDPVKKQEMTKEFQELQNIWDSVPDMYKTASNWYERHIFSKLNRSANIHKDSYQTLTVYHGTNSQFNKIDPKMGSMGTFWFTSNKNKIENGESGAIGTKYIMELIVKFKNPAGWNEYDKYGLDELISMGHDAVILPDGANFDGFIWDSKQIKLVKTINTKSQKDV